MAPYKNHFNIKQTIRAYKKFCHKSVIENIKKKKKQQQQQHSSKKTVNFYKELLRHFRAYVKSQDIFYIIFFQREFKIKWKAY